MPETVPDILAGDDDTDVCTAICRLLITHHGKAPDPGGLPIEHRTVLEVWNSYGQIGNGGFNGYFSRTPPGDPDFIYVRAAYDAMNCVAVTNAFRKVFEAFPDNTPPSDPRERLRLFIRANNEAQGALNRDYFKAAKDLPAALAKYIRKHAAAFDGLEGDGAPATAVMEVPDEVLSKTDTVPAGAKRLPLWAKAGFYARCARTVFPLWDEAWPECPGDYSSAIEQAILLAEMCAAQGKRIGNVAAASQRALAVIEADDRPASVKVPVVKAIATAAAQALEAVLGKDEAGSYVAARTAAERTGHDDLVEDLQEEFEKLKGFVRDLNWNEKTPVPPDVFSPDYKPPKAWWKVW